MGARSKRYYRTAVKLLPLELKAPLVRADLRSWGVFLVIATCMASVFIWLSQAPFSLSDPLRTGAKTSAFLAITLLSIEFVLSTRWYIVERAFEGLDRMYKAHKVVGKLALVFVVLHLLFLLARAIPAGEALPLVVPGLDVSYTWGILSLLGLAILLVLTVSFMLSYPVWRMTHRLMVVPLLLALWHALHAGSDIQAYPAVRYWTVAVCGVGLAAYLYTLVLYRFVGPKAKLRVSSVRSLGDVTEVTMEGQRRPFHPGQFVFVHFPRFGGIPESFPFSISSGVDEAHLRISAKALGDFTRDKLPQVRPGDRAIVRGPYGKFGERYLSDPQDMVWIAGGIGITPFLSMARHERGHPGEREVVLLWTFRDEREAVYNDELAELVKEASHLRYVPWSSRTNGRLTADRIAELLGGEEELRRRTFFLCGPSVMIGDMAHQLLSKGVHLQSLVFEDFSLL